MTINVKIATEAAERWLARIDARSKREAALKTGRVTEMETPERIEKRLRRLTAIAIGAQMPRSVPAVADKSPSLVERVGLERVIGTSDFLGINFLELALAVSRFVGRIHIRMSPGRTAGFGTGFMVSPRILLTNNHVLGAPSDAVHSEVEFDYQNDRLGRLMPVVVYGLDPETLFLTSAELDYTLVAVKERSVKDNVELRLYGWSRLNEQQGKALLGDPLNIIQHPSGQTKQIVLRSNQLVDLLPEFAHYVTDTEPGSSGAPVYNDQWELVALHHSGVPKKKDGNLIARNGSIWRPGMDPDELDWVANEGIRVSALVAHIRQHRLRRNQERLIDELLNAEPPHPLEAAQLAQTTAEVEEQPRSPVGGAASWSTGTASWTIPLEVTVRVGAPGAASSAEPPAARVSVGAVQRVAAGTAGPRAPSPAEQRALAEADAAPGREYYNESLDRQARDAYYRGLRLDKTPAERFDDLSDLLQRTHVTKLPYQPAAQLYPWVDLHESARPILRSVYSGKEVDPREFIREDFRIDAERERLLETLRREATTPLSLEAQAFLEASLPYNCEHVVPQSWFGKREPMRGDLHHLFACETDCNNFRGNVPYFDFADFEEVIRDACGKLEETKFEPAAGKGAVARATLYFLLRYPGEINQSTKEYTGDRIQQLLEWHRRFTVGRYEQHRNAAIFEKQGNRNPLIDFPEWADGIDFTRGLGK